MKIDVIISRRYFAASNSKRQGEIGYNPNFPPTKPSQLHQLLSKADPTL